MRTERSVPHVATSGLRTHVSSPVTPCPPIPCVGQWHSDKCVNTKCGTTNGNQTQVFKVTQRAKYDGKSCEAEHNDKRVVQCESEHIPCPVDCVGKPSEWSKCKPNHKCGSTKGERSRTFEVSVAAAHGGVPCVREDKAVETEDCEVPLVPCPPEPCIGGYSPPSACKQKECDNAIGVQTSVYRIEKRARYNGTECPAAHGDVKEEECTIPAEEVKRCPIDCKGTFFFSLVSGLVLSSLCVASERRVFCIFSSVLFCRVFLPFLLLSSLFRSVDRILQVRPDRLRMPGRQAAAPIPRRGGSSVWRQKVRRQAPLGSRARLPGR